MDLYNAIHTAIEAHQNQIRKIDKDIYVTHPLEVGMLLAKYGLSDSVIIAGILHDTLEDTDLCYDDLALNFGKDVADYVSMCSESDKSLSWKERKINYIKSMQTLPKDALYIICADKLSNIKSIYRNLNEDIWDKFNAGYEDQKWYYLTVLGTLKEIGSHPLYLELAAYIEKVFQN